MGAARRSGARPLTLYSCRSCGHRRPCFSNLIATFSPVALKPEYTSPNEPEPMRRWGWNWLAIMLKPWDADMVDWAALLF